MNKATTFKTYHAGTYIYDACYNSVTDAVVSNSDVHFMFNGVHLCATPKSRTDELAHAYYKKCIRESHGMMSLNKKYAKIAIKHVRAMKFSKWFLRDSWFIEKPRRLRDARALNRKCDKVIAWLTEQYL